MTTDRIFHRVITDNWPQISHGKDCYLYAEDGRAYLDACAGVHVVSIGHGVPEIAEVMREQANKVSFTYARFLTQPQIDLADKIAAIAPGDLNRVFFISGGSEATESALKMARKYHIETGNPKKYKVITRWQSWHGNTIGALSMSGRSTWREDYVPYLLDFPHITFPHPDHCPYCQDPSRLYALLRRRTGAGHQTRGQRVHRRLYRRADLGHFLLRPDAAARLLPHHPRDLRPLQHPDDHRRSGHRLRTHGPQFRH